MGTINYKTSNYITMGINTDIYSIDELKKDKLFMKEMEEEVKEYELNSGVVDDEYLQEYINLCYEDSYEQIKSELKAHEFCYYHITIEPGYYEGFHLYIENNCGVAYVSWTDRAEAQKEITEIKQFLINCAELGLVACFPGWGTSYLDYEGTLKEIDRAIKEMREEVKTIPTWRQYLIDCGEYTKGA